MRQSRSCLATTAILTLLVGCGTDAVAAPDGLQGEYALETVNGMTLPFLKGESASERVEVVAGSLTLRTDRTYSGEIVEQWTTAAGVTHFPETSTGTFRIAGTQLAFTENGSGAVYYGTINGDRISATLMDVTFGFVRQ